MSEINPRYQHPDGSPKTVQELIDAWYCDSSAARLLLSELEYFGLLDRDALLVLPEPDPFDEIVVGTRVRVANVDHSHTSIWGHLVGETGVVIDLDPTAGPHSPTIAVALDLDEYPTGMWFYEDELELA